MLDYNMFFNQYMPFNQKIMVIIRWIILISLIGYILTMNPLYVYGGMLSVSIILAGGIYSSMLTSVGQLSNRGGYQPVDTNMIEGFRVDNKVISNDAFPTLEDDNLYLEESQSNPNPTTLASPALINVITNDKYKGNGLPNTVKLNDVLKKNYEHSNWKNPFGNVLLPEIKYNTDRDSAPPSFNLKVSEDITRNVKNAIQRLNPGIKNTDKQLFGDLYNNFVLDNANRVFYSMPSTRVENDQSAFAQYLYHDLVYSGKESTVEGGIARIQDNYRYILN